MANTKKPESEFVTRYTLTYLRDHFQDAGTIQFLDFEIVPDNPNVIVLRKCRKPDKDSGPFNMRALYFPNTGLLATTDRKLTKSDVETLNNKRFRAKKKTGT